jgi:hypothetical protein
MTISNAFWPKKSRRKGQPLSGDIGNVEKTIERLGRGIACVFSVVGYVPSH